MNHPYTQFTSRKPSDRKLARKRGIIQDGLVLSTLALFFETFWNLCTPQGNGGKKGKSDRAGISNVEGVPNVK